MCGSDEGFGALPVDCMLIHFSIMSAARRAAQLLAQTARSSLSGGAACGAARTGLGGTFLGALASNGAGGASALPALPLSTALTMPSRAFSAGGIHSLEAED